MWKVSEGQIFKGVCESVDAHGFEVFEGIEGVFKGVVDNFVEGCRVSVCEVFLFKGVIYPKGVPKDLP